MPAQSLWPLFGLVPILRVPLADLKEGGRTSAGTTWRRFGANLVVAEVAVAMVLLVGAGLLAKSLYRLLHADIGMNADHLATLEIEGPFASYAKHSQSIALVRQIVDRIADLPSVKSVGISNGLPVGWVGTTWFRVVGRPFHGEHHEVVNRVVSAGYFATLEARLWRGRYFDEAEDESKRPVVIVNRTMAKQYFAGEDPIGKQIAFVMFAGPPRPPTQIVGIVEDVKEGPLDTAARPVLYVPFNQSPSRFFSVVVRTSEAEQPLLPSLAATIHRINSAISIHGEAAKTERINDSPSAYLHRSSTWLVVGFAATALLLSVVGLYGVVAYSVSQRTREIGIRMALGAESKSVYKLILGEAAWLAGAGTALGLVRSIAAATVIRRLLFGVESWDVPTLASAAAVFAISALLASYIPARRAAPVNPIESLRAE